ncbi:hypothetical protein [Microbacterium sp. Leaf151]|nr:hypothetical protein [Microbacterium sp. Leaf151]
MAAFTDEWPMPWRFDASKVTSNLAFTLKYNMSGQPASALPVFPR